MIELPDRPGQLLKVLEVIAKCKGNLSEVQHIGERKEKRDKEIYLPLRLIFFVDDQEQFDQIKEGLTEKGVPITDMKSETEKTEREFLVVGASLKKESEAFINSLQKEGFRVEKYDLELVGKEASAFVSAEIPVRSEERFNKVLPEICKKKNLLLVKSL